VKPGSQKRVFVRSALLALAFLVTVGAFRSLDTSAKVAGGELFVPPAEQIRFATFGFDAALSDYYWLTALQIVGDDSKPFEPAAVAKLIDVVTTLDPWVGHPYRFAAVWLTDSYASVAAANRLLERGVSYAPRDWRNRHYLGFNHFFYLGENAEAADILEGALGLPQAPRYLAPLVAKLKLERDGLETARGFLATLVESSEDPYAQAEYLKALDEIDTERRARLLDQARSVYVAQRGRDIERVEDLASGELPVLRMLPPAHPHFPGFVWEIHAETGEIVSSFYRVRYRPHEHWFDRRRRERFQADAMKTTKES
jgi:hypothetical protein